MLEAVVFLKDLQKQGLVIEMSRGVWLRAPVINMSTSNTSGDVRYTNYWKRPLETHPSVLRCCWLEDRKDIRLVSK